ncbi:ATP-binding cassette domain-containing protein [Deferribacteres bacterium DY0037]
MYDQLSISVKNVSKMYKIYKNNFAKIIDLLGFPSSKNYNEFWALRDINLDIKKGEKVGIIGHNGAGKTTLLSIISNNIRSTEGAIDVNGNVNALFTLGTGFHPEFSGIKNIRSSLAFQGVTGVNVARIEDEIIEFAELEGFIDQPVKTYSAGMYARLAFTVATAIEPDILIIDEILGAGDAYFASKALDRMKKLTSGGTTVLFVSHDLLSVQRVCDRCVWIDKGKIREDGATLDVIKSYNADVRKKEELRLLSHNSGVKINNIDSNLNQLLFRFITADQRAPEVKGLFIHKISLFVKNKLYAEINVGDSMDNSKEYDGYIITDDKVNWSDSIKKEGLWAREFKNFGAEYVHAIGVFVVPSVVDYRNISFAIEYFDDFVDEVSFEFFDTNKNSYINLVNLSASGTGKWLSQTGIPLRPGSNDEESIICSDSQAEDKQLSTDVYGTEEMMITNVSFLDKDLDEKFVFTLGDSLIIRIDYKCFEDINNPVFVVAVYNNEGVAIAQLIDKQAGYNLGRAKSRGFVNFVIDNLRIGQGEYLVSVAIFHDVDLSNPVEQKTYCLHDRKYKFKIVQPHGLNMNLGLLQQDFKMEYKDGND